MPNVLAIISKAVFEKEARHDGRLLREGQVFATSQYRSKSKGLAALEADSDLFLVTVRPGGILWLVAQLQSPTKTTNGWHAPANKLPIRDISDSISLIKFVSGKGITGDPGKLGMSLQTPRSLTAEDVALLTRGKPSPQHKATATRQKAPSLAPPPSDSSHTTDIRRLLATWRSSRDPELAGMIEDFSCAWESDTAKRLRVSPPDHKEWLALSKSLDELDRGALLHSLAGDSADRVKARVIAVAKWPADPRVANALHMIVSDLPWVSSGSRPTWTQIFKLLKDTADPRTVQVARSFDAKGISSSWSGPAEYMASRLASVAKAIEAVGAPSALGAEDARFAERLRAAIPTKAVHVSTDALLKRVLEHPDDDEARLVLADALQEQGDPRGTLIILQYQKLDAPLNREQAKEEKRIIKQHASELMGPLKAITMVRGREFQRGFLSSCEIKEHAHENLLRKAMGDPLLATIETLVTPVEFAVQDELRSLRHLQITRSSGAEVILRAKRPWRLTTLGFGLEEEEAHLLDSCTCLPNLKKLRLGGSDSVIIAALQSGLAGEVDWIELEAPALDELVSMIQSLPNSRPSRISASYDEAAPGAWSCDVIIDRTPTELRLTIEIEAPAGGWQGSLASLVQRIRRAYAATKSLKLSSSNFNSAKRIRDKDSLRAIRAVVPADVVVNIG